MSRPQAAMTATRPTLPLPPISRGGASRGAREVSSRDGAQHNDDGTRQSEREDDRQGQPMPGPEPRRNRSPPNLASGPGLCRGRGARCPSRPARACRGFAPCWARPAIHPARARSRPVPRSRRVRARGPIPAYSGDALLVLVDAGVPRGNDLRARGGRQSQGKEGQGDENPAHPHTYGLPAERLTGGVRIEGEDAYQSCHGAAC